MVKKSAAVVLLSLCSLIFLLIYSYQLINLEINSYLGYSTLEFNLFSILNYIIFFSLIFILFPYKLKLPSDFFKLFYILLVIIPNVIFSSGFNFENNQYLMFFFLFFPLIFFKFINLKINILKINFITKKQSIYFIVIISLSVALFIYSITDTIGSLDFISSYQRRIEGRDLIPDGSIVAYLFNIVMNCFMPYIAFISRKNNNIFLSSICLCIAFLSYWSLGFKSIFTFTLMFFVIGSLYFKSKLDFLPKILLNILIFISIFSILEFLILNTSVLNQLIIRRVFVVPAFVQNAYFFEIFNLDLNELLYGIDLQLKSFSDVTYYIGTLHLNDSLANANTNTFLYFLLKFGLIGYFICLIFVYVFYIIINNLYRLGKKEESIFIGSIFGLLICEKSFTATLISSGILFLFIIILTYKLKNNG